LTRALPLPQPSRDNAEFYAAAARGELRFQRCTPCRRAVTAHRTADKQRRATRIVRFER